MIDVNQRMQTVFKPSFSLIYAPVLDWYECLSLPVVIPLIAISGHNHRKGGIASVYAGWRVAGEILFKGGVVRRTEPCSTLFSGQ